MTRPRYRLLFAPETIAHLRAIPSKHHGLIRQALEGQLSHTPELETRNRKPLEQPAPFGATWELRFGPDNRFRAFYEIDEEEHAVWILAIGLKEGNRLCIAGEEFEL